MATILKAGNVASGAQITSDSTGILEIKTGTGAGTTAMVLDASQNVGIGTSSPDSFANFVFVEAGSNVTKQGVFQATDGTTKVAMYSTSGLGIVSTRTAHPLALFTNGSERARIDTNGNFQFNSGYGSVATAYGCRAWVNFNGTGTVAIRSSGNVTSITDNGTGEYTVNFTTAMPDVNYSAAGICYNPGDASSMVAPCTTGAGVEVAPTTTAFRFATIQRTGAVGDTKFTFISIFR
jgi:hypothetical protein